MTAKLRKVNLRWMGVHFMALKDLIVFGPPNADDKGLIAELYRATGLPLLDALKVSVISCPSDVPWRPAIGISLLS